MKNDTENQTQSGGIAETGNIHLMNTALERLKGRGDYLPGIAVLYGPAGWGKTIAATRMANRHRGYYVQMRSCWTRKTVMEKCCQEMGMKPAGTIPAILDQVAVQLAASRRPLILDEFDHCANQRSMVELVRDIHEAGANASILCIGEELLPQSLEKYERFHSRVLTWAPAKPVTLADAKLLAPVYAPRVAIADDLLDMLVEKAHGSVRRVCVNLELIHQNALIEGWANIDRKTWGDRPINSGKSPEKRKLA